MEIGPDCRSSSFGGRLVCVGMGQTAAPAKVGDRGDISVFLVSALPVEMVNTFSSQLAT